MSFQPLFSVLKSRGEFFVSIRVLKCLEFQLGLALQAPVSSAVGWRLWVTQTDYRLLKGLPCCSLLRPQLSAPWTPVCHTGVFSGACPTCGHRLLLCGRANLLGEGESLESSDPVSIRRLLWGEGFQGVPMAFYTSQVFVFGFWFFFLLVGRSGRRYFLVFYREREK